MRACKAAPLYASSAFSAIDFPRGFIGDKPFGEVFENALAFALPRIAIPAAVAQRRNYAKIAPPRTCVNGAVPTPSS